MSPEPSSPDNGTLATPQPRRERVRAYRSKIQTPRWLIIADLVEQLVCDALADAKHPWTLRWPTSREMAEQFDAHQLTMLKALRHLGAEGVLEKVRVPRPSGGYGYLWMPQERRDAFPDRLSEDAIAAEMIRRSASGEWKILPTQPVLAAHFKSSRGTIGRVTKHLAQRGLAVKLRVDGYVRWRIVPPHQRATIDPRARVPPPRVVVGNLLRRVAAGEFRYRLPDGTVHERPFSTNREIARRYKVSPGTVAKVRRELTARNIIVPGSHPSAPYVLASHLPPVNRDDHPAPDKPSNPPRKSPRHIMIDDVLRRIAVGEFRYRLPDGTIHNRAFPASAEAAERYDVSVDTVRVLRTELKRRNIFVPGTSRNTLRLADHIPPIDRADHPPVPKPKKTPVYNKRARVIAGDLVERIHVGEFDDQEFLGQAAMRREYRASAGNIIAAIKILNQEGLITFHKVGPGTRAFLVGRLRGSEPGPEHR